MRRSFLDMFLLFDYFSKLVICFEGDCHSLGFVAGDVPDFLSVEEGFVSFCFAFCSCVSFLGLNYV